ncbi:MAG: basic amino acid/polyamine antiporter, family [bacterium]
MAERRLHGLQRVLGVNALFSTAYGNVGSSIYYALGLVAALALGLTPVVFVITGVIFFWTAATYAEATAMYPEAGGSSSFARHAFNEFWSFFAAWGQMLNYVITVAISAFFVPHYVGGLFWQPLRSAPADIVCGAIIIVILAAINVRGAKESAGLNIALAIVDFMTQLLLVIVGIVLVLNIDTLTGNVTLGVAPTWSDFLLAIPIGMVAYTGIETISNLAEEAKDEATTIPAAISRVRLAVFAIYFTLPAVALSALPVTFDTRTGEYVTKLGLPEDQGGFAGDPILGVVKAFDLGALQGAAEIYVGLLAATILFIATNAGLIGVSRLVYSMGIHRQVPDRLRRLHPKFGTPWIGILVFGGVAIVTLIPGQAEFLSKMYAFGAMLSFTVAHLSVIRLRRLQPDFDRPYTGPGNLRIAGFELPLFAVLGGIGTALSFVVVTVRSPVVAVSGVAWLVLGIGLYVLYRRNQGLDLVTTVKVVIPRPVTDTEAEYESVLVAMDARHYSPQTIATAAKLAGPKRRGIHVLVTITVPYAAPMGEELPEEQLLAMGVIEQAKQQGGRRVTGHIEKVRPGGTGRLIVDEAREMSASAIVMPLPPRTGTTLFGKTVETVLSERPCRVIIESEPSVA